MSTVTESDLKELKDLILGIDKKLDIHIARTDKRFNTIDERFRSLEQRIDDTNKRIEQRIDDTNKRIEQVDKRIDSVNARLNTFTLGFLSIVGTLVTGLLSIVTKVVFFPNP